MKSSASITMLASVLSCFICSQTLAANFAGSLSGVTITDVEQVNTPPVAQFTYEISVGSATFNANGSSDSDGSIVSYKWDFGDGNTAEGAIVTHEFTVNASPVTLTVIDDKGGIAISQTNIIFELMDLIVDDLDADKFSTVGNWKESSYFPGYYNVGYKYAAKGDGTSTATWKVDLPVDGEYEIFSFYTAQKDRASNAPVKIINNGTKVADLSVNQQVNGSMFYSLGTFSLSQGGLQVTISNGGDGYSIADAIKVSLVKNL